jgi:hypothetical protein
VARNNPPLPTLANNVVRLTISMLTSGNVQEVSFCYYPATSISLTPAILTQLATDWWTTFGTDFAALLTADTQIVGIYAADISPGTTPTQFKTLTSTFGSQSGHALPLTDAAVLTWGTQFKGQHGRGRTYMPAIPIGFTTPATDINRLNATPAIAAYSAFTAAMLTSVSSSARTWGFMIVTRPSPPAVIPTKGAYVFTWQVQPVIGTIRRRREGRGI